MTIRKHQREEGTRYRDADKSMEVSMGDRNRGLYGKFSIARTDGQSEPGKKHDNCEYFVLDITHDRHALPALRAYAISCQNEYPLLSRDLFVIIHREEAGQVDK